MALIDPEIDEDVSVLACVIHVHREYQAFFDAICLNNIW